MANQNYTVFRRNYEGNISKKSEIDREEFHHDFYETKPPFGLAVFGLLMLLPALYSMFKGHTFYGILIMTAGLFFIYGGLKKRKLVFRVSKNGIWTAEFGFIYFRHIERFEFYRYIGKHSSERLKIHMKNYKMYRMERPFLEQQVSHIDGYGNLRNILDHALTMANKRNKNRNGL